MQEIKRRTIKTKSKKTVLKEVVGKNVAVVMTEVTEVTEEEAREGEDVVVATTVVLKKMTKALKRWLTKTRSQEDIVAAEVDIVVTEVAEVDVEEEAEVTAFVTTMTTGTLKDQSVTILVTDVVVMDVDVAAGIDHKQLVTATCEDGELRFIVTPRQHIFAIAAIDTSSSLCSAIQ